MPVSRLALLAMTIGSLSLPALAAEPSDQPVSFSRDIQAILTKAGCNQGACHGAQHGKGGFKLSLRGFDDRADYYEIVKGSEGRRVLLTDPEWSLLLTKPTLKVPHKGGKRLDVSSWAYKAMLRWIEDGAAAPQNKEKKLEMLLVSPSQRILNVGEAVKVEVTATYDDGSQEVVTHKASYDSQYPTIAAVADDGTVTAKGKGESAVMVRFLEKVAVSRLTIPFGAASLNKFAQHNFIDTLWVDKWKKLGLAPTTDCSDAEFYRRIHLDAIGTMPRPEDIKQFLADQRPDKRKRAIEAILNRPEYVDFWAYKWGDLLRCNRNDMGEKGMWSFHNWLRAAFRENKSFARFAEELITAVGSPYQNGPANFFKVGNNPNEWSESVAQVFLGVRMQCAQCHHHPFQSISQKDYYSMVSFFSRVGTKNSQEFGIYGRDSVIYVRDSGDTRHPRTGELMQPTPLYGKPADDPVDRRRALARWMTKENTMFAANLANRYWDYFFGRGLVDPVDDIRPTNPASSPEVLDALAKDLIEHNYDIKHMLRTIMESHVYQLSAIPTSASAQSDPDNKYCTHYTVKRMTAEQLMDAVDFACGTQEKYQQLPLGYRAISLPDTNVGSKFMDIFGRPKREITCECERADTPNMGQALQLMTGNLLNTKIQDGKGRIARLVKEKAPIEQAVEEVYFHTVSRPPTTGEVAKAVELVKTAPSPKEGLEDLLWAMLNTREFQFNH